jgi:hypothetical protein
MQTGCGRKEMNNLYGAVSKSRKGDAIKTFKV